MRLSSDVFTFHRRLQNLKDLNSRSNPSWDIPAPDMECFQRPGKQPYLRNGAVICIKTTSRFRTPATAPVSHQKRLDRRTTNAKEKERKRSKFNEPNRCPAARNGLVQVRVLPGPPPPPLENLAQGFTIPAPRPFGVPRIVGQFGKHRTRDYVRPHREIFRASLAYAGCFSPFGSTSILRRRCADGTSLGFSQWEGEKEGRPFGGARRMNAATQTAGQVADNR